MTSRFLALALAAGPLVANGAATATVWTLNDVTFTDGGTATGYFDFETNYDLNPFSNDFAIAVSGGDEGTFPELTYTQDNSTTERLGNELIFMLDGSTRQIRFTTASALSGAQGRVDLENAPSSAECYNCSPYRSYSSPGYVTSATDMPAVPEPATWSLMIGGFGLIGGMARRGLRVASQTA